MHARQLWCELHRASRDWLRRSWDEFCAHLPEDLKAFVGARQGETHVVVYGNTQVGKTTVMLALLGIREADMDRVGHVLRGHRTTGRSATSVATVYERSADDSWYYRENQGTPESLDDGGISARLAQIRQQMEAGQLTVEGTVSVAIPSSCFEPNAASLRLLDLPGVFAHDKQENDWAARLAARYLPLADYILLIAAAHDVSTLHPDTIVESTGHDWMRYWAHFPNRFGLVLTYAASAKSVQDAIEKRDGPLSLDDLRGVLREEHSKNGQIFPFPDDIGLYPLDLGDSWAKITVEQPVMRDKAEGCLKEAVKELHQAVEGAADSDRRRQTLLAIREVLRRKLNEMEENSRLVRKKLGGQISSQRAALKDCEDKIRGLKISAEDYSKQLREKNRGACAEMLLNQAFAQYDRTIDKDDKRMLKKFLMDSIDAVSSATRHAMSEFDEVAIPSEFMSRYRAAIDECIIQIDREFPGVFRNLFSNARERLKDCALKSVHDEWHLMKRRVAGHINMSDDQYNLQIQSKRQDVLREVERWKNDERVVLGKKKGLEAQVAEVKRRTQAENDNLKQTLAHVEAYDQWARTAFTAQLRANLANMYAEQNRPMQFLRAAALLHTIQVYRKHAQSSR